MPQLQEEPPITMLKKKSTADYDFDSPEEEPPRYLKLHGGGGEFLGDAITCWNEQEMNKTV